MEGLELIKDYSPVNEQEESDKKLILGLIEKYGDFLFQRECDIAHFTTSAWITNKDHTKVLMNWHNIYKNWGWLGGHNDGDQDFSHVALKEAMEESGLKTVHLASEKPISLEILPVPPHIKKGKYVSSHLHLNITYLLEADENEELHIKPDENSGLKWIPYKEAPVITNEEDMKPIYKKLNEAMIQLDRKKQGD